MLLKVCVNGARDLAQHSALSAESETIAAQAAAAVAVGAGAVHMHPKDAATGQDSLSAPDVARFVAAVRGRCPGVPVGVTTGAWSTRDAASRVRAVESWTVLPDFASVNWHEDGADDVAATLVDRGVGVEAGIWHGDGLRRWLTSPYRDVCLRALIELPDLTDAPAVEATEHVRALAMPLIQAVRRSCPGLPVLLHGEERSTWPAVRLAAELGLDTRVGLEDCLHLPDGRTAAGNADLVTAARHLMKPSIAP